MEPEVKRDELGDLFDEVGGIAERLQPFARHLRADDFVMMERNAIRSDLARGRLSDVVQQAGHAQSRVGPGSRRLARDDLVDDRERVPVHVLVPVDGVLLKL